MLLVRQLHSNLASIILDFVNKHDLISIQLRSLIAVSLLTVDCVAVS